MRFCIGERFKIMGSESIRYETTQGITRFIDVSEGVPVRWGCYRNAENFGHVVTIEWKGPDKALRDFTGTLIEQGKIKQPTKV
tara:strand:+ start:29 stop:277 length:249 start_codon:yes stop_codon:yes gene_type:complete